MSTRGVARRLADPIFLASITGVTILIVYLADVKMAILYVVPGVIALLRIILPMVRQRGVGYGLDQDLVFLITHMYTVSTGKPVRRRLFELNTIIGDYGVYSHTLRRIAVLAVEWGYGFVRATRLIAREVRNEVFRGFLFRLSEVLRTGEDISRFLRVEHDTLVRQYHANYMRSLDLLRIFLGLYATMMSSSAFIVLTLVILAVFMGGDTRIFITSMAALLISIGAFLPFIRMMSPHDPLTIGQRESMNPRLKRIRNLILVAGGLSLVITPLVFFITRDPLFTLGALAVPFILPGMASMRFERFLKNLNSFFQVFVRTFGLTYSVIPNYAEALSSILTADYGPLTNFLRRLHARITNGIDPHIALRYFGLEASSLHIAKSVNIIADTIDAGGDAAEMGLVLSNLLLRLNDLRIDRDRVSRTFEAVVYLLQGLIAGITAAILNIMIIFASYYQRLAAAVGVAGVAQYLPFTITLPNLSIVSWSLSVFLVGLVFVNAFLISYVRGGLFETSFFHVALLTIITVIGAKAMEIVSKLFVIPALVPPI
ncbi:MAG: type II secretion system F family protein [Pyrodictiaceae archaeon]